MTQTKEVTLTQVEIHGESFFKITNSHRMRPFFMSIVSDSNHWMFVSSNGGLSAGRKNSECALFPYYTDDKITESAEITGSKTIIIQNSNTVWEPFSIRQQGKFQITRNLYKNLYGNKVIFEEVNHDLQLTFRYQWSSSNAFGFVKTSELINLSNKDVAVEVLDGLQNILPYGVPSETQTRVSNLVDAYKKSELEKDTGLGIFALSAIIVDKAEPSEALKANVAWSLGLDRPKYLLSSLQLEQFRQKGKIEEEHDIKAEKGAYFVNKRLNLSSNSTKEWMLIANVNHDHAAIVALKDQIKNESDIKQKVIDNIQHGTEQLVRLSASADGLQLTADHQRDTRHFANTLFNIMRGGIFDDNYNIERWDFVNYLNMANTDVANSHAEIISKLPEIFDITFLKSVMNESSNKDFKRLCIEYMPLKFSRRHGDPSRPWNKFSINTRNEDDGSKILDYEGNWRDIFQNWEALAHAFPAFIESMIHKFLNASTFDGYNPYRVTKDGFDWETIEPDDPWSYIGYWGDHQIIYLLKFLEFAEDHYPGLLAQRLTDDCFVYANVPYKIKSYQETLNNPKDTIDFDEALDAKIRAERKVKGADGALLMDQNHNVYKVNFAEKVLAAVLAKVSNFIPEAGIWLNTQRPEWNDANNALVGNGVSMVTLYYLRRFLNFFNSIVNASPQENLLISRELNEFFEQIVNTLDNHKTLLSGKISDKDRKTVLDGLGEAGSAYRLQIYAQSFSGEKVNLTKDSFLKFIELAQDYLEHSIAANQRNDHLYHAYNLMTVENDSEISISYLEEMLEGQVAVLSSGYLSSKEALQVLDALKSSSLFRPDQYSYILYPNKTLSRFMDKNNIPQEAVESSQLLQALVKNNNKQIIIKDIKGGYHFNGNFNNAESLKSALKDLDDSYQNLVAQEQTLVLNIFEKVFNHKEFTGRSGTFFGYEGLGSIYWHMVSKLQLAVQECCVRAMREEQSKEITGKLLEHYYEINEGIGVHKSPELYGAFPTDPYSHTPATKGAQQPGMTGQVKEDILSRIGELGVFVRDSNIVFNPFLLRKEEFLKEQATYKYVDVKKKNQALVIDKGQLAFSYCQIPVIYNISESNSIEVCFKNGSVEDIMSLQLNRNISAAIFNRADKVEKLIVNIEPTILK